MNNAEKKFTELLGDKIMENIKENNWVKFDNEFMKLENGEYGKADYQFEINFMEKDGKNDTVIHCSIHYNEKTKKWWSENCIDSDDMEFDTFEEVKQHLIDIEDDIIGNGFNTIEL